MMDGLLIGIGLFAGGVLAGAAGMVLLRRKQRKDASGWAGDSLLDDETLMLVARATNDALWDLDLRTNELHWSEQLSHNFGYEEGDLRTVLDWWTVRVHPEDREHAEGTLNEAIAAGRANWSAEYRFLRADGSYADVIDRGHTMYDAAGRAVRMIGAMIDVTPLREAERALHRKEQQFVTLVENAPDVIARFDRDLRHLYVNKAVERATGIPAEDFIGKTNRELGMPRELVDRWEAAMRNVFETEAKQEIEFEFDGPEGQLHMMALAVPERNERGEVTSALSIVRDITEFHRAQEASRKSEERYRTLFESNPHPMWVFDVETLKFLAVNEAAVRKYGYTREEFSSMTIKDIRPLEDVPELANDVEMLEQNPHDLDVWRHRLKDGTLIDVEITSNRITFEDRPAALVLAHDVTERLRAERALRESEQRFATFMNNNPAVAWIKDADGCYAYVNPTLCCEYQVSEEEVIGHTDHELLPERVADVLRANDETVIASGEPIETIEAISNPDGTDHIWLIYKFPIENSRGETLVGGLGLDITEQKQNEQALREYAEALERSNRDLEQFAYVASHDLQEPLRMVSSYTSMLAKRYKGQLDADADEFIEYAVGGATRMQRLIQDLLSYSRIGSHGIEITATDADEALDTAIQNISETINEHGATVQRQPLPRVKADHGQLVQLFQNLLTNSIKFRGDTPPCVQVFAEQRDNDWVISVRDNGVGIDPEYQEQIFVIFRRLHSREKYAGTGIGLALCKRIVERHGGRIWVESAAGRGSTFRFTIPAAEEISP